MSEPITISTEHHLFNRLESILKQQFSDKNQSSKLEFEEDDFYIDLVEQHSLTIDEYQEFKNLLPSELNKSIIIGDYIIILAGFTNTEQNHRYFTLRLTKLSLNSKQPTLPLFLKEYAKPLQILYTCYVDDSEEIQEQFLNRKDISISDLVEYLNIFQSKLDSKLGELENYGSECSCHTSSYLHIIKHGDMNFEPEAYLEKTCLTCGGIKEST